MDTNVELIALVRHGRSIANDDPGVYRVMPDHAIPLSRPDDDPACRAAGAALARLPLAAPSLCSWRSPYRRCLETEALVMGAALGPAFARATRRESFLLREQEFGDWDGLTEDEMAIDAPALYARRDRLTDHRGRFYFRYPNGESRADVVQRLALFLGKLHRSSFRQHVIFLHGVTQRAFRMAWFNHPVEWLEDEPNPGNATVCVIARGETGHWHERVLTTG